MLKGDRVRVTQGDNRGKAGVVTHISLGVMPGSTRYGFAITVEHNGTTFTDVPDNLKIGA